MDHEKLGKELEAKGHKNWVGYNKEMYNKVMDYTGEQQGAVKDENDKQSLEVAEQASDYMKYATGKRRSYFIGG